MNKIIAGIKPFISKHEAELLLGMGIGGMLISTYWGIKATIKAVKKVDDKKKKMNINHLSNKEIFKETWKLYLPMAIGIGLSVPCIISSNTLSNKRNAALATAFTITERSFKEYQDKTKDILGEKKEKEIHEAISTDRVRQNNSNSIIMTGNGDSLFFEPLSGRYFKSNWNKISKAANELNADVITNMSGYVTLTDWYLKIGLDSTELSDNMGWSIENGKQSLLNISLDSVLTSDDIPCGAIYYNNLPKTI